ncbi:MAG: ComEC/Rec2 family competence protein, partial [Pirellulales bacterium]
AIGWGGWGIASLLPASRGSLEVTVASMQHGLGILVRPPSGEVLVYDAGRLGAPAAARRAMEAVLRDAGVGTIDMLAISHADSDHFNAVTALMERFTVRRLVLAAGFLTSRSPEAMRVVDEARQRQIPVVVAAAGDSLAFAAGATLEVLHPLADAEPDGDDNADSLVCLVEACGRRLLLTGDLEGDAVDELLARGVPHCDAMVAPHHGTRSSLPPRLAAAVRPRVVLVSGTGGQSWDEVREAYEQTGPEGRKADVVCTCQSGAIRLQMDAEGMSLARGTALGWSEPQRLGR